MTITPKIIVLALLVSLVSFSLWTLVASQQKLSVQNVPSSIQKNPSQTQESSEGNVAITITPRVLFPNEKPVFDVTFDTHSVDLAFDVASITTLEDQDRNTLGSPVWEGSPPGGHHRNGTLSFSRSLNPSTRQVSVTFFNIANIPKRTFAWEVKRL